MLETEEKKIKKLTQDIITNGISPLENFAVIFKKGKYLVLEGNRRVIVLKLLDDPKKAEEQKFREFFVKMKEKALVKIPNSISCTVFENEDDSHHWIKLKHTGENGGAGIVPWNGLQQDNFLKKASRKIQIFEFAKENDIDSKGIEVTNLERLIQTPYVCTKIGISFKKGELNLEKPKTEVKANLKKVFERISKKEFKVGDIYNIEQRKSWINGVLGSKSNTKKDTATSSDGSADASDDQSTNSTQGTQKNSSKSTDRKHLIPKDCILAIPQGKINDIYLELKDDLIIDASKKSTPNAVSVLFRVFLELSLDRYIDKKKIKISKKLAKKQKSPYKKELSISEKIEFVSNYMEQNGVAQTHQLTKIRRLASSANNMLNITTFHEFVHSPSILAEDLKPKWSNIQSFFEILWNDFGKKGN